MYHRINDQDDALGLAICPDYFDAQLQYLRRRFWVLSLPDAISRLESGRLDRHAVVITFDDGWRDNMTFAFPLLRKYEIPATIFLVCDAVEKGTFGWHPFDRAILATREGLLDLSTFGFGIHSLRNLGEKNEAIAVLHQELKMVKNDRRLEVVAWVIGKLGGGRGERVMLSWKELEEMVASGLINIGAHTLSHPILTRISAEEAWTEIHDSKQILEEKLKVPVDFFAYPNGGPPDFNEEMEHLVAACGFRAACSSIPGRNTDLTSRFALRRMDITYGICRGAGGNYSRNMFSTKVSGVLEGILFRT